MYRYFIVTGIIVTKTIYIQYTPLIKYTSYMYTHLNVLYRVIK